MLGGAAPFPRLGRLGRHRSASATILHQAGEAALAFAFAAIGTKPGALSVFLHA